MAFSAPVPSRKVSRRDRIALLIALALALCGGAANAAWSFGLWLTLSGAILLIGLLTLLNLLICRRMPVAQPAAANDVEREATVNRLLLDASPTPLVLVEGRTVRTLNRAARALFGTDDRVLPAPPRLFDRDATHLRHAGRSWRADRVEVGAREVVALIDVESEERTAEARATAEMVQVLGHEMLNGLVPIVSLAECGIAAADPQDGDPALLPEILSTLARRAESLQRFTQAYRALARLPPPLKQVVPVEEMIEDLARLFASHWPSSKLVVEVETRLLARLDRDQLNQGLWALLQNAVEATSGSPDTIVRLAARSYEADLMIEVTDNGPGVPSDQVASIFRPFHTTKTAGTGIGLSLARQIAQAHGGTLVLVPAAPTTFRLRLPAMGNGHRRRDLQLEEPLDR